MAIPPLDPMMSSIPWEQVDTVLLDLDGVLLDLCFDNCFWEEYIPRCYAQAHQMSPAAARREVLQRYEKVRGTIAWYSPRHWSKELGLDVETLEQQRINEVRVQPGAETFLHGLRRFRLPVLLVTNANSAGLACKLAHTGLDALLDDVISSHLFGQPKEQPGFWPLLQAHCPFVPERTLLVDDNEAVLDAARSYGIGHLRTVLKPDSSRPPRRGLRFPALDGLAAAGPGQP